MSEEYIKIHDWYMTNVQIINKLDNIASKYGISFIQYSLLLGIMGAGATPLELAKRLNVSKTTVSRILKTLTQKKLVEKIEGINDNDKRQSEVFITQNGKDLVKEVSRFLNERRDLLKENEVEGKD